MKLKDNNKTQQIIQSSVKSNNLITFNNGKDTLISNSISSSDKFWENRIRSFKALSSNNILRVKRQDLDYIHDRAVNIDRMTYEQILDLQDKIGYVNVGYSNEEINVLLLFVMLVYRYSSI